MIKKDINSEISKILPIEGIQLPICFKGKEQKEKCGKYAQAFETKEACILYFSPANFAFKIIKNLVKSKTFWNNCFDFNEKLDMPSLNILKLYLGDLIYDYLELWISNLQDFINVKQSMTSNQITETAYMIMGEYYYFTPVELYFIFLFAKRGNFGELYSNLSGSKIMTWFQEYDNLRSDHYSEISVNEGGFYKDLSKASHPATVVKIAEKINKFKNNT